MTAGDSDEALMRAVALGDEAAFRRVAARHLPAVLRLARRMLGSVAEAEDIAQEALLRLWTQAARWQPERARLATWLHTIVYRLCVDRLRLPRHLDLEQAMEAADPALGTLETLTRESDLRQLERAMAALPPRRRAALTLFYHDELSGPEAAAVLGLGLRAFWSLLHRARQAVQQHMQPSPSRSDTEVP